MSRISSSPVTKSSRSLFTGKIEDLLLLGENTFNNGPFLHVRFRKKLYSFVSIYGLLCPHHLLALKNVLTKVIRREKMKT